jgi:hypothetical protein
VAAASAAVGGDAADVLVVAAEATTWLQAATVISGLSGGCNGCGDTGTAGKSASAPALAAATTAASDVAAASAGACESVVLVTPFTSRSAVVAVSPLDDAAA